jgi:hypothetical protein
MVIVYSVDAPAVTAARPSVLVIDRSADFVTESYRWRCCWPRSVAPGTMIDAVLASVGGA